MKRRSIILFVLLAAFELFPQQIFNWRNYSYHGNVTGINITDNKIWASTEGGMFSYFPTGDSFLTLAKSDGLREVSLTSVASDEYGRIWAGNINGVINIYNPGSGTFEVVLDIFGLEYTNKSINFLTTTSDTLMIATDYGVSLIDINTFLFLDTYVKYGEFPTNTKVNFADKLELFYICTDEGIAIQKNNATNLSAPESWNTYTITDGLLSNKVNKAVKFQGSIIAATDKGMSVFNGTQWQPFLPQFNNNIITDLVVAGTSLIFPSNNTVYSYTEGITDEILSAPSTIKRLLFDEEIGIVCATGKGLYVADNNGNEKIVLPNGPAANQFLNISVDNNGKLWSASGIDGTGKGVYSLYNDWWINYNTGNTPSIPNNDFFTTFTTPDNSAYLGLWGSGFIKTNGNTFEWFNTENTGMQGIPENPNFLVITGFANDSRNNIWILNHEAADRRTLSVLTPGSEFHHFIIPAAQNRTIYDHFNLDIDPYDTKWFGSKDVSRRGLYYFNEMGTFDNDTDDRSGFITTLDGLNNDEINTIVVDKRGDIWIGTSQGINVISNTNSIIASGNPSLVISSVFALRQQAINDIAVDPINQKWVATNQGLLLVNSDGSRLITTLDSKNSPLLSDQIITVAIDQNAGIVYAATEKGLTSFETPYILPTESFNKLFIYPNPFEINNSGVQLTIDGLVSNSELKILSVDGKVVADIFSPGGRIAFWDGKDNEGNYVNSGVYIIAAFDSEGSTLVTGKVAVLRR